MKKDYILTITFMMLSIFARSTIISTTNGLTTGVDSHGVTWTFTGYDTDEGTDSAAITLVTLPANGYDGVLAVPGSVTSDGVKYYNVTSITGNKNAMTNILGKASSPVTTLDLSNAESLTSINDYAFFQFNALSGQLVMPENVRFIGCDAFYNMALTSVVIPDGVTHLGDEAFGLCQSLTTINLPKSVIYIGNSVFSNCSKLNIGLDMPVGVAYIGDNAFYGCVGLTGRLTLSAGLTYLGKQAFFNCGGLTGSVIVPEGVTAVNPKTFYHCGSLNSIAFKSPALDLTLAQDVFDACASLEYIDMSAATDLTLPSTMFKLSRTSSSKDPFYELPARTVVYLPNHSKMNKSLVGTNANYVYYDVSNGWTCPSLSLQDACSYNFQCDFTATKIAYDRVFKAVETSSGPKFSGFNGIAANTLYLPFPTVLPGNMSAYTIAGGGNGTVDLGQIEPNEDNTTTLEAYTPYVVKFKDNVAIGAQATLPAGTNVKIIANPVVSGMTNNGSWAMHGTTKAIDNATAASMGAYNLEDNVWHIIQTEGVGSDGVTPASNGYIGQFRCYITPNNISAGAAPQRLNVEFLNTATNIGEINVNKDNAKNMLNTRIYTIDGRYAGDDFNILRKGMYVVNGKKVLK